MAAVQSVITIVIFLVMLGTLVVIHELGHFVAARLARVRVLEFGIGFPPRAKVLRSEGETLYTLNWLPIGGFVKLEGEDGESEDPKSFTRAPLLIRLLILAAGALMNLVLAFVIFFATAWLANPTGGLSFDGVQANSPASTAGLVPGDVIATIGGRSFDYFDGPRQMVDDLRAQAGKTIVLGLKRAGGVRQDVTVTLRQPGQIDDQHGALGISTLSYTFAGDYFSHDLGSALQIGAQRTTSAFDLIAGGLGQLVGSIATHPTSAPPVSGPVGIAVQVGDVFWQLGPIFTLYLAGILSANLALVNILPFPPLDGGRIAVSLIKSVAGQRVSMQAERLTYFVGFVFLFAFLIWITYFDIARIGTGTQ
jgi:regulator of sigma E protease